MTVSINICHWVEQIFKHPCFKWLKTFWVSSVFGRMWMALMLGNNFRLLQPLMCAVSLTNSSCVSSSLPSVSASLSRSFKWPSKWWTSNCLWYGACMCMMELCLAAYSFPAKRLCDLAALEHLNIWQLMSRSPSSTAVTHVKIFLKRYTILANWNCGETSHGIREMGQQMPIWCAFSPSFC